MVLAILVSTKKRYIKLNSAALARFATMRAQEKVKQTWCDRKTKRRYVVVDPEQVKSDKPS